jgi:hypothetical protein
MSGRAGRVHTTLQYKARPALGVGQPDDGRRGGGASGIAVGAPPCHWTPVAEHGRGAGGVTRQRWWAVQTTTNLWVIGLSRAKATTVMTGSRRRGAAVDWWRVAVR